MDSATLYRLVAQMPSPFTARDFRERYGVPLEHTPMAALRAKGLVSGRVLPRTDTRRLLPGQAGAWEYWLP